MPASARALSQPCGIIHVLGRLEAEATKVYRNPEDIPERIVSRLRRATGATSSQVRQRLIVLPALLLDRIAEAVESQPGDGLLYDPVEHYPSIPEMRTKVENEAQAALVNREQGPEFRTLFWSTKKRIFAERYGVEWFTPAEMNPGARFD